LAGGKGICLVFGTIFRNARVLLRLVAVLVVVVVVGGGVTQEYGGYVKYTFRFQFVGKN
jgi:hypothetical protein